MIVKSYETNKIDINKVNFILMYGDNQGFKDEVIKFIIKKKNIKQNNYYEKDVLDNSENFFNTVSTKSFFENEKIIVIKNATDKIRSMLEEIINKNFEGLTIILDSGILEKKSKLRTYFEKQKSLICVPFYPDNHQSLNIIIKKFFNEKNIQASQETLNLIIERSNGSRQHLNAELNKIENFMINKKEIKIDEIMKLTNLGKDYEVSDLIESCLAKDRKKISKIINENNFSNEDVILILRVFLSKAKRLLNLKIIEKTNKNIDAAISAYKPPIFWKDKEIVKKQAKTWTEMNVRNLIKKINEIELSTKKNSNLSQRILINFIFEQTDPINN